MKKRRVIGYALLLGSYVSFCSGVALLIGIDVTVAFSAAATAFFLGMRLLEGSE